MGWWRLIRTRIFIYRRREMIISLRRRNSPARGAANQYWSACVSVVRVAMGEVRPRYLLSQLMMHRRYRRLRFYQSRVHFTDALLPGLNRSVRISKPYLASFD